MSESAENSATPEKETGQGTGAKGTPASSESGGPAKKGGAPGPGGPRKRGFWRRWTRRFYLAIPIFVLLMIGLRVALIWLLPPAINKAAGKFGLECHYDKLDMSLLGGDFGIWHVKVTPVGSNAVLAAAAYCRLDVSTLALLRGQIHISRLEADGADVEIDRDADGSIPLLTRFAGGAAGGGASSGGTVAAPMPAPATTSAPAKAIDLAPPISVDSIRVSHVQAHLVDKAVTPAMSADLNLDFWLDDLGSASRPLQWGADVRLWPVVDVVHVEGHGTTSATDLAATMTATVRGIHPREAAAYLRGLGIEPIGQTMAASMKATLSAKAIPAGPGAAAGLKGSLDLSGLELSVDGNPAASAGGLSVVVDSFSAGKLVVSRVSVDTGRVAAVRTNKGTIVAAGMEFGGTQGGAGPAGATSNATASGASPLGGASSTSGGAASGASGASSGGPASVEVREIDLHNLQAAFHDDDTAPAADLAFVLNDFAVKNVMVGSAGGSGAITFGGTMSCPGVTGVVKLDGSASPWGDQKSANFKLDATGVNPTALQTYLRPLGIESQLKSGEFTLGGQLTLNRTADGGLSGGVSIAPLVFADGQDLLAFDSVTVSGLTLNKDMTRIGMSQVKVAGPRTQVVHEAGGAWRGLGLRFDMNAMGRASAAAGKGDVAGGAVMAGTGAVAGGNSGGSAAVAASANNAPPALPRIQIDELTWGSVQVGLRDEGQNPAASVTISDAGLELKGLVLDASKTAVVPAATAHGWVSLDGIAKRLEMTGNVTASLNHPVIDVQLDGQGLNLAALGPYLKGTGVEPLVKAGELHLHAGADVVMNDAKSGGPVVSATLAKVSFADGTEQLAGLESLKVDGFYIASGTNAIHVAGLDVSGAFGSAGRDADGALMVAGIRLGAGPAAGTVASAGGATTRATVATSALVPPVTGNEIIAPAQVTTTVAAGPWRPLPALPLVNVGNVKVTDAKLKWSDRADGKSIDTAVTVSVQSGGIVIGTENVPSAFKVQLKADSAVDSLAIDGKATLSPDAQAVDVEVTGSGLRAGTLAGYVPAGMKVDLVDGRLHAKLGASLSPNPAGGMAGSVAVSDVDYRDGESADAFLKVGSLRAAVGRIDPVAKGNVIDIEEISSDGIEAQVHIAGGVVQAMGVTIGAKDTGSAATNGGTTVAVTGGQGGTANLAATQPVVAVATAASGPNGAGGMSRSGAAALFDLRHAPPTVTLGKLDVRVARLTITDGDLGGEPVVVSGTRLWSDGKLTLLNSHPETLEPAHIKFSTAVDPVVKAIDIDTAVALFLPEPTVKVDVLASGINGAGLERVMPKLKERIDGGGLVDGRFRTHVEASASLARRGAFDIDWTRPVQAQVNVQPIEFKDGGDGSVLAGVDQIEVNNANVNPVTGDVLIGGIDISKPTARVWKDQAGTHVLDLVIRDQAVAATTAPSTTKSESAVAGATTAPSGPVANGASAGGQTPGVPAATQISAATPGPEIRVDRLTVSGLDFQYKDTSVEPPMTIPLTDLSVNVQNLTNRAMTQSTPITFSVDVRAGKVELPKRAEGGATLFKAAAGLASLVGNAVSGNAPTSQPMEQRDLFEDITADGAVALYPEPKGTVKANISAVEMGEFKGPAAQDGVSINGGLFDGRFNLLLPGDGTMTSESKIVLTNAQMKNAPTDEPAKGRIANLVTQIIGRLPGALDAVIAAVQDANGAMTVPLNFKTKTSGLSGDAIASVLADTIVQSIGTAFASAPVKVVNTVIPIADLLKKAKEKPIEIDFAAADSGLDAASQKKLADLEKRLKNGESLSLTLRGELGGADVTTVYKRIDLDPADSIALAEQLRAKKVRLTGQRQVAAESARAQLATGLTNQAAATVRQLAALDRELGETEDALDSLYDLLRPGSEQIVARRARQACLDLASARLEAVKAALVAAGGPKAEGMIHTDQANATATGDGGGRVTIVIGAGQ